METSRFPTAEETVFSLGHEVGSLNGGDLVPNERDKARCPFQRAEYPKLRDAWLAGWVRGRMSLYA